MKKYIVYSLLGVMLFSPLTGRAHIEVGVEGHESLDDHSVSLGTEVEIERGQGGLFGKRDDDRSGLFGNREDDRGEMKSENRGGMKNDWGGTKENHRNILGMSVAMRFKMATVHLEGFFDRLDSRIDKIKAEGKDTASAEAYLAEARTSFQLATTEIEAARTIWEDENASAEAKAEIRAHLTSAKNSIMETQNSLRLCIKALKDLYVHTETDVKVEDDQSDTPE